MAMLILGILALLAYLALCIVATHRLWNSAWYERGQKVAQTALLWLLPIIGPLLVFAALHGGARGACEPGEMDDDDDHDSPVDFGVSPTADHAVASADA